MSSSAAARNSSYKLQGLVTLLYRYRISPSVNATTSCCPSDHAYKQKGYSRDFFSSNYLGYGHYMNQGLRSFSTTATTNKEEAHQEKPQFDILKDEEKKTQPAILPVSSKQGFSTWAKWLLGSLLSLLLPYWKQKWERLKRLEGKVEMVVEEVEVVAEVVENVADAAEKLSSEVAETLPDGNKIKQAILVVEHLSSVAAQEAQLTKDFIHKIGEVEEDLKEMETIAEPVIDKIVEPHASSTTNQKVS